MKIKSLEYELDKRRYVFEFEDRGLSWFRFLDKQTIDSNTEFKDWLNSMIDEVKVRN
jgi:hypothetical protein